MAAQYDYWTRIFSSKIHVQTTKPTNNTQIHLKIREIG